MRLRNCAATAVAIGIAAGPAGAADLGRNPGPYYSAPAYAPASIQTYSWMGPYLGINAGYQWGRVTNNPTRPSGFAGGIQGGYNFQTGQFVFGGETDLQLSAAEDRFAPWKFSNPWFGTLRGRAGVALNNVMIYATGGMAYGGVRAQFAGVSESHTHLGWTAGLGLEVGLTQNWSVKGEYLFVGLGERGYTVTATQNAFESNLLRFGVNYRF
jgi:outer membrane immunogenic protein